MKNSNELRLALVALRQELTYVRTALSKLSQLVADANLSQKLHANSRYGKIMHYRHPVEVDSPFASHAKCTCGISWGSNNAAEDIKCTCGRELEWGLARPWKASYTQGGWIFHKGDLMSIWDGPKLTKESAEAIAEWLNVGESQGKW